MKYTSIHVLYLLTNIDLTLHHMYLSFYGFSLIYLSIYLYVFLLFGIFSVLFIFDLQKLKTLNDLRVFNKHNFISITTVLIFLSMAGIPPLSGFLGKFLFFNFLFITQNYILLVIFSVTNFFSIYFYIQNLRFLISQTQVDYFFFNGYRVVLNKELINLLVIFNFFNLFGFLYVEDFLYFLNLITLYKVI